MGDENGFHANRSRSGSENRKEMPPDKSERGRSTPTNRQTRPAKQKTGRVSFQPSHNLGKANQMGRRRLGDKAADEFRRRLLVSIRQAKQVERLMRQRDFAAAKIEADRFFVLCWSATNWVENIAEKAGDQRGLPEL